MANRHFHDYDRFDDRGRDRHRGSYSRHYEYTDYERDQSQGPQINVYNTVKNDQQQRPAAPPAPAPPPPQAQPTYAPPPVYAQPPYMGQYAPPQPTFVNYAPYPAPAPAPARRSPSPDRRHRYQEELLVEGLAEMRLGRSHSQSRARAEFDRQAALNELKLAEREEKLKELQMKADYEREGRRIREEMTLKQLREEEETRLEEARRDAEFKARMLKAEAKARDDKEAAALKEKMWQEEYQRKEREAKDKKKAEEQRIRDEMARKEREDKEAEERLIRDIEYRKKLAKEKEEKVWAELQAKKKAEKEAEEARLKEAERMIKEREDKKKAEEKAAKDKADQDFRDRLRAMGYSEHHINGMLSEEKDSKTTVDVHTTNVNIYRPSSMMLAHSPAITYPKIRREYLAAETLEHYNLKWEYDRDNDDYIIILRHLTRDETEMLFEHTRRLRSGTLLIESSGKKEKKHEYAWVRHRSKSRQRVGILEMK